MFKSFDVIGESRVIFHHLNNRLKHIFTNEQIRDTNHIFISTYNFNFIDKGEETAYKMLKDAALKGVLVTLVYALEKDGVLPDEEFIKLIKCIKMDNENNKNHSKLIILDSVAYIGSANFTNGSDFNYEVGTLLFDKTDINKLRMIFIELFISNKKSHYLRHPLGLEVLYSIFYNLEELFDLVEKNLINSNEAKKQIVEIISSNFYELEEIYGVFYNQDIINFLKKIKLKIDTKTDLSQVEIEDLIYNLNTLYEFTCSAINHINILIEQRGIMNLIEQHYK